MQTHNATDSHDDAEVQERAMVEFALRWVNSGGGPESQIRDQFALDARSFFRRIEKILNCDAELGSPHLRISELMRNKILAVARRRIWMAN